ncbi:MAG: MCP four helix bundle domain-containing protein [Dehalococcoidia bacterium]|nr:MCP four helix bundle domain-containing protein [Dehalococcoidia bacterium]
MKHLSDLSIRLKLFGAFGLVVALIVVIAFLGTRALGTSADRADDLYHQGLLGVHYADQTLTYAAISGREQQTAVLNAANAEKRDAAIAKSRDAMASALEATANFHETVSNAAERDSWNTAEAQIIEVFRDRETLLKALENGQVEAAVAQAAVLNPKIQAMNASVEAAISAKSAGAQETQVRIEVAAGAARLQLIGATVIAAILGLAVAFFISRKLKNDVDTIVGRIQSLQAHCVTDLRNAMQAMQDGDLTLAVTPVTPLIPNPGKDEIGVAATAINATIEGVVATVGTYNAMRASLADLVRSVRENASNVLAASSQLSESSEQMASATTQIASAITEVTQSATQLASLSQQSAEEIERVAAGSQELAATATSNAVSAGDSESEARVIGGRIGEVARVSDRVAASAEASREAALTGQQAIGQAVASMASIAQAVERASVTVNELGEYSSQIGAIVRTIDEIASQTNLLALNAAIEAARAGEQGRGFAVVAENVRSLAERSSQATREIGDLIARVQAGTADAVAAMSAGVSDVQAGRRITTEAGEALESIIGSVQESATEMQRIAHDVRALNEGADRITASAQAIAQSASDSASGAHEMAAGTSKVTEAILQVSATSEQTSASAEEVSASTEQLSAQSEELAATATAMRQLAQSLETSMARFRLA